jgi:hypothetical protein
VERCGICAGAAVAAVDTEASAVTFSQLSCITDRQGVADMADPALTSWLQTGGVLAFAGAVLWELRQLRPLIKDWIEQRQQDRDLLGEVKRILSVLLERERMRSEQREKLIKMGRRADTPVGWDDDDTGAIEVERPTLKRPKTNPLGVPTGEYHYTRKKDDR